MRGRVDRPGMGPKGASPSRSLREACRGRSRGEGEGRARFAPLSALSVYHLKRGVSREKSGSDASPDSRGRAKAWVLAVCGGESGRAVLWA